MTIKAQVRELADQLPETATWDDVLHEIYVQQLIARGISDIENGRLISHEEIRREFLK